MCSHPTSSLYQSLSRQHGSPGAQRGLQTSMFEWPISSQIVFCVLRSRLLPPISDKHRAVRGCPSYRSTGQTITENITTNLDFFTTYPQLLAILPRSGPYLSAIAVLLQVCFLTWLVKKNTIKIRGFNTFVLKKKLRALKFQGSLSDQIMTPTWTR